MKNITLPPADVAWSVLMAWVLQTYGLTLAQIPEWSQRVREGFSERTAAELVRGGRA